MLGDQLGKQRFFTAAILLPRYGQQGLFAQDKAAGAAIHQVAPAADVAVAFALPVAQRGAGTADHTRAVGVTQHGRNQAVAVRLGADMIGLHLRGDGLVDTIAKVFQAGDTAVNAENMNVFKVF